MLGGNPESMARDDLKKAGIPDEIIVEATGYADTDNEEILAARRMFADALELHKKDTSAEAERVREAGGLFIIGTERHESRRIDNQLRGRSGRQGDPGETRFFLAMTDDIMRLFGTERIMRMMETLNVDEDTPLDQKILSNAIEQSQMRVESRNFQTRKRVLEYDDVMNTQRGIIYDQRRKVLDGENIKSYIHSMTDDVIERAVNSGFTASGSLTDRSELDEIIAPFTKMFLSRGDIALPPEGLTREELTDAIKEKAFAFYDEKERALGTLPGTDTPVMRELERIVLLRVVDEYWMDHIDAMSDLRQSVGLRAYGQSNPVDEYKRDGFDMFEAMVTGIREEVVRRVFTVRVKTQAPLERKSAASYSASTVGGPVRQEPVKKAKKPGRNDPCPCGKLRPNGLPMKYKDCCGKNA